MWEPWNEAANQMQMNMGMQGQLGSPRGRYSGAAQTALGQLYADAGQQVGMQAWNMIQPGEQAMYNAELARNMTAYQSSLIPWQQNYQRQVEAWQYPFGITPGMVTGNYPSGIVTQQGNPWAGAAAGGMQGAMMGANWFNQNVQPTQNSLSRFRSGMALQGRQDQWAYNPDMNMNNIPTYGNYYGGGYGGYQGGMY
jgi:hypothetical protein